VTIAEATQALSRRRLIPAFRGLLRLAAAERIAKAVVVAAVVGLSLAFVIWALNGLTAADVDAYWNAAIRIRAGASPYVAVTDSNAPDVYRYAPWFAYAWVPLTYLPKHLVVGVWVGTLAIASVLATKPMLSSPQLGSRLLALLTTSMLLWTSARGNVQPLVLAALVHGIPRASGPLWIAMAASLKGVPLLFVIAYAARREWSRVVATLALTAALVLPALLMSVPGFEAAGASLSLFHQASPEVWAVAAVVAILAAITLAWLLPRYAALAAATAAVMALPRLLLYDMSYLIVGLVRFSPREPASEGLSETVTYGDLAPGQAVQAVRVSSGD